MHYQINDIIVKSELAAKPLSQTNKYVLQYISLEKANEVFLKLISLIKNDTMDLRGSQYLMSGLSEENQQVTVFNDIDYDLSDIPLSVRIVEE